jgi:hypothetical protein
MKKSFLTLICLFLAAFAFAGPADSLNFEQVKTLGLPRANVVYASGESV